MPLFFFFFLILGEEISFSENSPDYLEQKFVDLIPSWLRWKAAPSQLPSSSVVRKPSQAFRPSVQEPVAPARWECAAWHISEQNGAEGVISW